ncbi:class I SAM-dependent methyltransferase [Chroococcidiopsis sp. CCALA 051]|jgi:2-polyprenyl-3-methyl-5-hydroxy-6-metoxy-1,4-benzoquinol methylase|uniref:class I SAM-dependent methyltransferase n=1 Tax=unclassified Chroococcidiopsis TaxID=2646205 RepID=UPI000D053AA8|nr:MULTISPECIES: class I SAM-dependent methyltransferase [unclassified Chroococcidiopsis]MBE9018918.1 class I SAM-dependent methyltransferase [Chroococcidiopsidales cyanobacterium LEGE 13417]PSB49359.1 class I SAM-dependent methyltransferase [Cyanosarcina cf. burmensis CCALA 770]PSM48218.1 class I SAM-dependent methyltransferase [Chroococcidiopsis sp. CCALA 051]URD51623.1 class I SAM-dependent methyltransferase [Chroococcidiopsis sp. CCNUC1]
MDRQFQHPMLPQVTHDELARQNFVKSLKLHIVKNLSPGNKRVYEQVVKPQFEREHQRSPQNRHEIRTAMQGHPHYRWWSALRRINQEMLWDAVNTSVERQLPELIDRAKQSDRQLGTLTLDPNFKIPAYQTAVDIHCMPGSYHSEYTADDLAAGATYDRGVYIYGAGWLGPLNDDMGLSIVKNYLKPKYPDFRPAKILDLGCSVGHSTLPYVDAYPEAEVYAIDIGAPMLRYAHARAEALGKRVHFSQQNAERTHFEAASFDLIVSHILLHEIPLPAIRNVMRECDRLLAPGGMTIHVEAPLYSHMDAFSAFMYDWETANNNEPFWSAMRELDLTAVMTEAGFAADRVIQTFVPNGAWKTAADNSQQGGGSRGSWFIVAATK